MLLLPYDSRIHHRLALMEQLLGHVELAAAHHRRHSEIEKAGNDLPLTMNAYAEAIEAHTVDPEKVKNAMRRFVVICQGLGLTRETEFWKRELAAM